MAMEQKKIAMIRRKHLLAAIVSIAAFFAAFEAGAQTMDAQSGYIEVSGYAEIELIPDTFYLRVDLSEEDSKGKNTIENQQKDLLAVLSRIGVDTEKDLRRIGLSSAYFNRKTNLAEASYQLRLTSPEQVSKAWKALDAAGFSRVSYTKSECSNIEDKKNELRAKAMKNAKDQAEAMAEAIGEKAGRCIYIGGGYVSSPVVYGQNRLMSKTLSADSVSVADESDTISFNEIKLTASVTAKFLLGD